MCLSDKNVCVSAAFFFVFCRPADCHRAAGSHEYVKELSKQVFSKQQRLQVDQKLVASEQQEFRTVSQQLISIPSAQKSNSRST